MKKKNGKQTPSTLFYYIVTLSDKRDILGRRQASGRLCVGVRIRSTFEDTPTPSRGRGTQKRVNGVERAPAFAQTDDSHALKADQSELSSSRLLSESRFDCSRLEIAFRGQKIARRHIAARARGRREGR
jgi:hypothetical protein